MTSLPGLERALVAGPGRAVIAGQDVPREPAIGAHPTGAFLTGGEVRQTPVDG